jgi:hypothetical protein
MTTFREEPLSARPEPGRCYGAIVDELGVLRSRGLSEHLRPATLPALNWATGIIGLGSCSQVAAEAETTELELLEYGLRQAAGRLDRGSRDSLEALLGLRDETRGKRLSKRREVATSLSNQDCGPEAFRTHYEKGLLTLLAAYVCALVIERYLLEWEARLGVSAMGVNRRPR